MSGRIYAVSLTCIFSLVLFLAIALPAFGQSADRARITAVVEDPSEARIPNASVKLINAETGAESNSSTNKDGIFAITGVLPGHYTLQIKREGFDTAQLTGITLNVGDDKNLVVGMKIGQVAQTVTVDASAITVNTTDASVSTVVDRQFIENLPLNGRSFQSLLYLTPGVSQNTQVVVKFENKGEFVVNGQRGDANYWMVDGVSANLGTGVERSGLTGTLGATNLLGGTSALVSVDALQEFRIETSSYAPEFGRVPGGQISIQTRSGTNKFHGTAFDYFRNTVLDATDWFTTNKGLPKPPERQNDFGGVIGGPIIKNKTFFFFSYEGIRLTLPKTFLGTVPDLAARQSAIPAVQPYLNSYPLPKPGAVDVGPGLAPYSASFSNPSSADAYSIRIDHQLSKNLTLFGRYNQSPSSGAQRGSGPANHLDVDSFQIRTATVGATWTKSSQVANDARFNYSTSGGTARSFMDTFGGGTIPPAESLFPSPFTYQNGVFLFAAFFGTNMAYPLGLDSRSRQRQYNAVDTVAVQKGVHSLKFGFDYRRLSPSIGYAGYQLFPIFVSLSELEAGNTRFTLTLNTPPQKLLLHNLGVFAHDN